MRRSSRTVQAPESVVVEVEVEPVPESRFSAVAGRVTPLAATAADRLNAAAGRVTPLAHTAADQINAAAGRVGPLAHSAADQLNAAAGRVGPLAHSAVERVSPLAQSAVDQVTPYAQQAASRVAPLAAGAWVHAHAAQDAVEGLGPKIGEAWGRVPDAVDAARDKVTEGYLPRLGEVIATAGAAPVISEAGKRSKATLAAARGELTLPEPKVKRGGRLLGRLAVVAAVAGVVALVVRKLLGSKDDEWQAARPSTPYVPASTGTTTSSTTSTTGTTVADAPTTVTPEGLEGPADGSTGYSGDGVYVGLEPPEGFVIKGNERSMKYHTPDSDSYTVTTAEVWFDSEDAAQRSGFVKAGG